jgi:hypothetical protein
MTDAPKPIASDLMLTEPPKPLLLKVLLGVALAITAAFFLFVYPRLQQEAYEEQYISELHEFGAHYHDFTEVHKHGPKDLNELQAYQSHGAAHHGDPKREFPLIAQAINDGKFKVVWNSRAFTPGLDDDEFLLAHEVDDTKRNLWCLLGGGSIRKGLKKEIESFPRLPEANAKGD